MWRFSRSSGRPKSRLKIDSEGARAACSVPCGHYMATFRPPVTKKPRSHAVHLVAPTGFEPVTSCRASSGSIAESRNSSGFFSRRDRRRRSASQPVGLRRVAFWLRLRLRQPHDWSDGKCPSVCAAARSSVLKDRSPHPEPSPRYSLVTRRSDARPSSFRPRCRRARGARASCSAGTFASTLRPRRSPPRSMPPTGRRRVLRAADSYTFPPYCFRGPIHGRLRRSGRRKYTNATHSESSQMTKRNRGSSGAARIGEQGRADPATARATCDIR